MTDLFPQVLSLTNDGDKPLHGFATPCYPNLFENKII